MVFSLVVVFFGFFYSVGFLQLKICTVLLLPTQFYYCRYEEYTVRWEKKLSFFTPDSVFLLQITYEEYTVRLEDVYVWTRNFLLFVTAPYALCVLSLPGARMAYLGRVQ